MIGLQTENWKIENIETVLFDKDGTFIDLHYFWGKITEMRAIELAKTFQLPQEYTQILCLDLGYNIKTGKMLSDGITALYSRKKIIKILLEKLKAYNIKTTFNEIENIFDRVSTKFYKDLPQHTKLIPEAIEFIKKLHSLGVKLGIVTSDSVVSTDLTLKLYNLDAVFDVVIGRESSSFTKESGEPVKLAVKKLGANPKTTIMIGDAPTDYLAATNAGIDKTILVSTGQIEENELLKTSSYVVDTLAKIFFTSF